MDNSLMKKISRFIIEKRAVFTLIFLVAVIYCVMCMGKVKINPDITSLLPAGTETRQGLSVMDEEFVTYLKRWTAVL